ncbi:MAG: hypothetical protein EHM24_03045 [Acidobacteria bacterium]|nr:MAG: hypothetical protein EHM24_03045 [Acidobacteriota bacterium]
MKQPIRVLLTGGGTAGHVNPALAIGRALAGEATRLLYVGVRGRAEAAVVPREGLPIRFVRASGYPGTRPSAALLRFLLNTFVGSVQAVFILLSFRPEVIVGTGGYASAPVMFAAAVLRRLRLCRARVFVHEQNAAPGKLNLLVGRLADKVFVTFPETLPAFPGNAVLSGYPLRRRIAAVTKDEAATGLDFQVPPGRRVVFAFGGSQGARTINRAVVDALRYLLPCRDQIFIIHGTGLARPGYEAARDVDDRLASLYSEDERREIASFYVSRPYFYQIEHVYAVADLVVARAGAGSLYELASLGLPAIVIPKANLPGDHQVMNARAMARCGGARVLYEETVLAPNGDIMEQVDGRVLADSILMLLLDDAGRGEMGRRSRAFLQHDALAVIERVIRGELEGGSRGSDEAGSGQLAAGSADQVASGQWPVDSGSRVPEPANEGGGRPFDSATDHGLAQGKRAEGGNLPDHAAGDSSSALAVGNEPRSISAVMLAPGSGPQPVAGEAPDQVPSNHLLLARLERAAARLGREFSPLQVVPSRDDLEYFVSRAASLLVHSAWEQRNLGVKLLGFLHARDRTPLLLALLRDRRPAPLVKRLLGGDFVQVGFIRRNIVSALARLGQVTPEVEAALIEAFHDPYYEVRAESARAVSALSNALIDRAAVVAGLTGLLQDRWLEVAVAGAEALGRVGCRNDALPALLAMRDARYWVVRAAALRGLLSLVERGEGGDPSALLSQVNHFVLTSTDFKPEFQIKRLYGRLLDAIEGREGEDR